MREPDELMNDLIDEYSLYSCEGKTGLRNLNQICSIIGYKRECFAEGSPVELFLYDNPEAIKRLIDFIVENMTDEWSDNIAAEIPEYDEGE
ncbi:MAG: hypothetical protein WDA42_00075 [Candidatus Bathyarchaeia archaeon]|jgi:hypothetical protein